MRTVSALILAGLFAGAANAAPPAPQIVVFGTSLSDPGNAFALIGGTNTAPDYSNDVFLVPDRPYARGGHHFTNGDTWIEQLARTWRLAANADPAFRSDSPKALNFAVGGARARLPEPGNLSWQVDAFLHKVSGAAPADALYVVEMGANDVRDALFAAAGGGDPSPILMDAAAEVRRNIERLRDAGAHRFFVWNAPDIGLTPALSGIGAGDAGTALSSAFNLFLATELATVTGIQRVDFDAFVKVGEIFREPQDFGLSEVNAPCITPNVPPFHCENPDQYLFWDGIHPTRAAHGIIAHEAAQALGD